MLLDAHPEFEADVRDYLERKLMSKKGTKLTVASFAAHLNTVLMPSHEDKESRVVDLSTFPSRVPHISHTVAWRYMVLLGFKCGSLKKGAFPAKCVL